MRTLGTCVGAVVRACNRRLAHSFLQFLTISYNACNCLQPLNIADNSACATDLALESARLRRLPGSTWLHRHPWDGFSRDNVFTTVSFAVPRGAEPTARATPTQHGAVYAFAAAFAAG